jgi:hypothetical protein
MARVTLPRRRALLLCAALLGATAGACRRDPETASLGGTQRIVAMTMPGPVDSVVERTRAALSEVGETPVQLTWDLKTAVLSTTLLRGRFTPQPAQLRFAAIIARGNPDDTTVTTLQLAAWRTDFVPQVTPTKTRPVPVSVKDRDDWARLLQIARALEGVGGRRIEQP